MSERSPIVRTGESTPPPRLCALPTETVYGLAARADLPEALEALRRLKGRADGVPFTWHAGGPAVLGRFERLRPLARRLAERYWPGPLTLVLSGAPRGLEGIAVEGWTGVRVPAHPVTRAILEACEFPVVMSSANRHGELPLTRAEPVAHQFDGAVALVVDGGPSRLGEASGVLALGPGRFELLREGLLGLEELRRTAGLRLAFVCTGNTCRSPMAEAVARSLLLERLQGKVGGKPGLAGFGFEVTSMGVFAATGAPASTGAVEALATRGIDLGTHRSRPAIPEVLARYDRVYGLTEGHLEALRAQLPPGRPPTLALLDPEGRDIADPIGGSRAIYERSLAEIERAVRQRLDEWA